MFLTLFRRFYGPHVEISTPFQFINLRYFAAKSGKGGNAKNKKQSLKKSQEIARTQREQLDTAKEYFQRVKKSGKQIYKGVKDVVTGKRYFN
jgi:hypothetical protein